jgi:hypothetical protein
MYNTVAYGAYISLTRKGTSHALYHSSVVLYAQLPRAECKLRSHDNDMRLIGVLGLTVAPTIAE